MHGKIENSKIIFDSSTCLQNEVDIGASLTPGMTSLLRYKTTPKTLRKLILQGHRFGAEEALEHNLVDAICPEKELLVKAKELALQWAPKAKAGIVYRQLKEEVRSLSLHFFLGY